MRVEVEGLEISYERAGSGPLVVLLHGYVGDGSSQWRHQLDALEADFTAIAWDAPGAGASSDPPEDFGVAGYADCLAGFIRAVGFEHAHVIGLSFGGALALALYDRHPEVVDTLVLASAYAGWHGSLPPDVAEARLEQALRLSECSGQELADTLLSTMFASPVPPDDVAAFRAAMEAFHPVGFRAMSYASAEDLSRVPPNVAAPTLLIYGDHDVRAPLDVGERLHREIVGSRLEVIGGVGHVCNVEAPGRFNDLALAFLADHGPRMST